MFKKKASGELKRTLKQGNGTYSFAAWFVERRNPTFKEGQGHVTWNFTGAPQSRPLQQSCGSPSRLETCLDVCVPGFAGSRLGCVAEVLDTPGE